MHASSTADREQRVAAALELALERRLDLDVFGVGREARLPQLFAGYRGQNIFLSGRTGRYATHPVPRNYSRMKVASGVHSRTAIAGASSAEGSAL